MFSIFRKKKKTGADPGTPITDARYVVIDTELTGLDDHKDSIVSIGAVRMNGGRINLGDAFYRVVSPRTRLTAESVVIHEITPSEVAALPGIDDVLAQFLEFCGRDVLVGHFISIDLAFLNRETRRLRKGDIRNAAIDTFSVYEWLRGRKKCRDCFVTPLEGYRLYDLLRCFGIEANGLHNAAKDAYATAQLFQRFLPLLSSAAVKHIDELLSLGIPFKGGDRFRVTGEISNF